MRRNLTAEKLRELMLRIGREAKGAGCIYLTGGASMLLWGVREQTIDVDMKLDPEPAGVFEIIARLKNELDVNIELASPDLFIPATPDWRERSPLIDLCGLVSFYHIDPRLQVLSKIERGHGQDLDDCKALMNRRLVRAEELRSAFTCIKPSLIRYPSVDLGRFEQKVTRFLQDFETREQQSP